MATEVGRVGVRWPRSWRAAMVAGLVLGVAGAGVAVGLPSASAATVDTSRWYVLVSRNSGKAMDVYQKSTADGAAVTQWARNDGTNQQWQFVDSGGGYYRLRSRNSSKVMDVYQRSTADRAAIVQWSDNGGTKDRSVFG
ncbi:RICIN domain-containing protein [Dactylosporangium sp. NPDC051541]|uniref:RICIN domain-containing protein n=1 Tax=Dactylosporangium sp. NPDC051541 TaxID=3363977 RepID=UPI00378D3B10